MKKEEKGLSLNIEKLQNLMTMNDYLAPRHLGVKKEKRTQMLAEIGFDSMEKFIEAIIPTNIINHNKMNLPEPLTENKYAEHIMELGLKNKIFTSYIGQGWYDTITPSVILRNIFENPSWYTSYTPYQAEISQGRLEALLNFQTVITDMTGLPLANASLLDEATAAAEAATMAYNLRTKEQKKQDANILFVDKNIFPQTLAVIRTRASVQGFQLQIGDFESVVFTENHFGAIVQYPNNDGNIEDYSDFVKKAHEKDCTVAVASDIFSLALLKPPGEWGADIAFGSTQRFGIPMFYGGPSAAYFATRDEYKREVPGRIIGVSKDKNGRIAYRLALQTREQHIKRERATSNICTAQALLATMAGFYVAYHGENGIKKIAERIHSIASYINEMVEVYGFRQLNSNFFDTLKITLPSDVDIEEFRNIALDNEVNFRYFETGEIGISIDETTDLDDVNTLIDIFSSAVDNSPVYPTEEDILGLKTFDEQFERETGFLKQEIFNKYHTETDMMRYMKRLERKDLALNHSMISLGSCTMKLNAASEMLPLSRPEFNKIHPLAPTEQATGYMEIIENLEKYLSEITGFSACSLQPNSGAAGEFTGLLMIRSYLNSINENQRNIILIPASAHGTNPASAVQCGFKPVVVKSDDRGNVDQTDWQNKIEEYADVLAGCMITYPSTHGIFEKGIRTMCEMIHEKGGLVYMDGANMNAQVGITSPGFIGADVCHLNLHKTFAIPHGGGGPGVGPICVAKHLVEFLPDRKFGKNVVAAAPYGSAGVLPITYGYIRMMGAEGLREATETALLNANYLAAKLKDTYGIVYSDEAGLVGHELILECRDIKTKTGITETDIAKRLIDYGYHAPTLSFPVHGTLMIEPTESESLDELNKFLDALMQIYAEIQEVAEGKADKENNVLINAPHPEYEVVNDDWNHPYSRQKAAYPNSWVAQNKFWVNVARVDNAFGDRNLICTCPPTSEWE